MNFRKNAISILYLFYDKGGILLSRLELKLSSDKPISNKMVSVFHGAIMELLPSDYAQILHLPELKPYTLHMERRGDDYYLICTTMNKDAYILIIENVLLKLDIFHIRHHEQDVQIVDKKLFTQDKKEIAQAFYNQDCGNIVQIQFVSPTAFKQNGTFIFFPDIRLIYQSLMNKYDAVSEQESFLDADVLEKLAGVTKITGYHIRSEYFHVEGVRIPAFIGNIKLKISANQTMVNFANMLFEYGKYSGVGVKCSLGMGAIHLKIGGMKIGTNES